MSFTIGDLVVYNHNDELALIVEVKRKFDASKEWAARLRRNILAHGVVPRAKFFLLALPDRFYLWKDGNLPYEPNEPDYEVDPTPILQPYFDRLGISPEDMSGQSFELLIASWLNELIHSDKAYEDLDYYQSWLLDSGLSDELVGGRLAHEAVV
ncbi:MAG: hypothetical protein M3220_02615 [Chloroflexota bacterium]|nr:hypothetical protein [Chloroflexota bacterium]